MKVFYFLLFTILFTSIQTFQAQTTGSFIKIKKKNETYFVSGVVINEIIKNQIVEAIKSADNAEVNTAELKIDDKAALPAYKWKENLTKQIAKIKNSKTAFFQINFTPEDGFPEIPAEIFNAEIVLTKNDEKTKLDRYKNETVILSLIAHWSGPDRQTISILNQLHGENLKDVRIIAVSVDEKKPDGPAFVRFVEMMNMKFQTGWANKKFINDLVEFSKFRGVPQTFIIKDGRLRGVFMGGGVKVNEQLIETHEKSQKKTNFSKTDFRCNARTV